jgi:hypothetical protein
MDDKPATRTIAEVGFSASSLCLVRSSQDPVFEQFIFQEAPRDLTKAQ